ncbi:helix-hairpin-helix domain-containing protein [Desulforhopalus sp. IMCC35007]|uniref:ComEA family DNA-binding protein n=1 Tax=Desulforhopalus sp. IMCC35007 TaxID=2569543 RepID=UPI0010AE591E|nr:helix-hairpin-helix domain-containing protein [Desulforhopalus sp. IMCC35007]TKB11723.1 helix-hairpin-helix domain-containing protein [Desulforhopalus sp. IMCC35007]
MKIFNFCIALLFALSLCISVPVSSVAASAVDKASKTTTQSTKSMKDAVTAVNVNTADEEMLTQLPGVGPATASAIVKYRKANGNFKSANDLLNVKGIGEKTLAKMKPFLNF